MATPRVRLVAAALGALGVMVLLALLAVRTGTGQHLDELAREGRKRTPYWSRRSGALVLRWTALTLAPVVIGGATVVLARRGRRRRAWDVLVGAIVAVGLVDVLKHLVLSRPHLTSDVWASPRPTFPSGNATLGFMVAVAYVAARGGTSDDPDSPRDGTVTAAAGLAVWTGLLVGSGWHRPSDVAGGLLLGLAVACAAAALEPTRQQPLDAPVRTAGGDDRPVAVASSGARAVRVNPAILVAALAALAALAVGYYYAPLEPGPAGIPMRFDLYLASALGDVSIAIGGVVMFTRLVAALERESS